MSQTHQINSINQSEWELVKHQLSFEWSAYALRARVRVQLSEVSPFTYSLTSTAKPNAQCMPIPSITAHPIPS
ncbi:MAG: hypothetical protein F6K50_07685 [Moorea sp. SIO3I7]|nr:hypothetical protein [Moorena sp. SIO3I7]